MYLLSFCSIALYHLRDHQPMYCGSIIVDIATAEVALSQSVVISIGDLDRVFESATVTLR